MLARGEDQMLHQNYASAMATFKEAETKTKDREIRAKALLGLGRCYIELGRHQKAIAILKEARKHTSQPGAGSAIERALGEAYFQSRDYDRASHHLDLVVSKLEGTERDQVLMRLAISAHYLQRSRRAVLYLSSMENPSHPELTRLRKAHGWPWKNGAPWKKGAPRGQTSPSVARKPAPKSQPQRLTPAERQGTVRGILSRRWWGARPLRPRKARFMGTPRKITVHHSGGSRLSYGTSRRETAQEIKQIQVVHQRDKGWADIGYHFIIDRAGRVWEGRPIRYQGAHAGGRQNIGNIGVVLLGDFTRQRVQPKQAATLERFLTVLCRRYRIPPHRVKTHAEVKGFTTQCPGRPISRIVEQFRRHWLAAASGR